MRLLALACSAALLVCPAMVRAQHFTASPCSGGSDSDGGGWMFGRQARACEVRRATMPLVNGQLGVAGQNGGIEVIGEDRGDVAVEAKVTATGSSKENAESILRDVRIVGDSGNLHAEGPSQSGGWMHGGWSVSYKLRVPRRVARAELRTSNGPINVSDLEGAVSAATNNGGIVVAHVRGDLNATSTNGALRLEDVGGTVHAQTTNGGVQIALGGARWQGGGLFARSTNGGISLRAPGGFAAHLVANTTNGGISVGFPITVQGKIGRHLDTEVNGGGPLVRLETTNGGVSVDRS